MFTFRNVRILFAAALLAAIFCLAGCSTAAQAVPQPAETSRSAEATPETAAPAPTSTPAPTATPEPTPAAIVPTSVTLDQEGGILNRGMTWTLRATVLPEDAADKTVRWTSSDESVATIDDAGVITALHPGQTTITARVIDLVSPIGKRGRWRLHHLHPPRAGGRHLQLLRRHRPHGQRLPQQGRR